VDLTSLKIFIPEIFLSVSILFQLFLNICTITNFRNNYPVINIETFSQCFFILFCLLPLCTNDKIEAYFFNFLFNQDLSVFFIKILIIFTSIFALLPIMRGFVNQNLNFFEYYSIFLISLLSTLLLVCSSNLLSIYLVLEMQTLSFYILASFKRNSAFSTEAGLKYFVIGSFISGLFLFGSSNIYGLTGTLNFNGLTILFDLPFLENVYVYYTFLLFSAMIITVVFLFKVSAVPFHFWSPDVYEGAPLSSTIIFSVIPKFAIFYLFMKWLCVIDNFSYIKNLLLICGIFSIFVGSFMAIKQKRLKRLIIYSSIAQTGFLLVALSINNLSSFVSIYFFLIIYIITSILIWTIFSLFFSFQNKINIFYNRINYPLFLSTLSSFFKINKSWSISNIIIFFSLAGIPPFVGFLSKLLVVYAIVDFKNLFCSFILLIVGAVSVFYYLRIIKIIFFDKNLSLKIESSQIIFNDFFFDFDCILLSFFLFLLIFLFFSPSIFIISCNLGVINFFLF
jgi:NADH-quinone oxidoreductase subunit N